MQKKVIVLALAGLVSGVAFAQTSNLTVYGGIDFGPVRYWDSKNNTRTLTAIEAGKWKSVRIGFKGEEDLGDGMKLRFKMDIAPSPDDKASLKSKTGYIGLSKTGWGEVTIGGQGTFADDLQGDISTMFGHDTAAAGDDVWMQASGSAITDDFLNSIIWTSPTWNGFTFKLGMSTSTDAEDLAPRYQSYDDELTDSAGDALEKDDAVKNDRVYAASVRYENGGLIAGAYVETSKIQTAYDEYDGDGHETVVKYGKSSQWGTGASYDFGFMRVHGVYNRINFAETSDQDDLKTRKQWQVGASVPVSAKGTVAVAYTRAKNEMWNSATKANGSVIKHVGVGYWYALSKKSMLYAAYGQINQNDNKDSAYTVYFDEDGKYAKVIQTGITYKF